MPSANDRFLIGTRHKCHRSLVSRQSYSRCRSASIIVSPNPIGPAVQTVFPKRLKIKCANRHVPSATNRLSMGTVIFPRSKTSISASPCCDRTSRSDIIRERAKNKDCANRNRHVPSATDRLSTGTVIFPMSKQIDYCLSQSDRTSRSDGIREKAKNKVCQSSCAKCHQSSLNGHRHLPEAETRRVEPLPFRSDRPFGRYSRKG